MRIILDSDIFIDALHNIMPSLFFLKNLDKRGEIFFSAITEAEILSGKECNDLEKLKKTLEILTIGKKIDVNNFIAQKAGEIRRKFGLTIQDSVIASTAILMDATLFTRNTKDFHRVADLKIKAPY